MVLGIEEKGILRDLADEFRDRGCVSLADLLHEAVSELDDYMFLLDRVGSGFSMVDWVKLRK